MIWMIYHISHLINHISIYLYDSVYIYIITLKTHENTSFSSPPPPDEHAASVSPFEWDLLRPRQQPIPLIASLDLLLGIPLLVGGWTNPFEEYARQIGSWNPKFRGESFQKYLKPPPRLTWQWKKNWRSISYKRMVMFHCHLSFGGCIPNRFQMGFNNPMCSALTSDLRGHFGWSWVDRSQSDAWAMWLYKRFANGHATNMYM